MEMLEAFNFRRRNLHSLKIKKCTDCLHKYFIKFFFLPLFELNCMYF